MSQSPQLITWDFRLADEVDMSWDRLNRMLKQHCRGFCYQLERGEETGLIHYQGRIKLKEKLRMQGVRNIFENEEMGHVWLSPTSNANASNQFYVSKEETRIPGPGTGPWRDDDIEIPWDLEDITLWPWQQTIVDSAKIRDRRHINIIVDANGNMGKTTVSKYCGVHKIAQKIPSTIEKAEDIMQMVMDMPKRGMYIIDLPRALNQAKLSSLYTAIEVVKDGHAHDKRYKYREEYFAPPVIWVFCNTAPDAKWLTGDRWVFWYVVDKQLHKLI